MPFNSLLGVDTPGVSFSLKDYMRIVLKHYDLQHNLGIRGKDNKQLAYFAAKTLPKNCTKHLIFTI